MSSNISPELQKQIEQEAKKKAEKMTAHVPAYRFGYEDGWNDAAEKYADLWQRSETSVKECGAIISTLNNSLTNTEAALREAEQRAEETTEKIIDLMDFVAEAKGKISDEEIISQVRKSLPGLLEALTPKTSTDELHKES